MKLREIKRKKKSLSVTVGDANEPAHYSENW